MFGRAASLLSAYYSQRRLGLHVKVIIAKITFEIEIHFYIDIWVNNSKD